MNDTRSLSGWESELLGRLLSAKFPGRDELRRQAETALVERIESQGAPALLFETDEALPVARVVGRVPVEGECQDVDGVGVHVLLHVQHGRLAEIEIFREDGEPIQQVPDPSSLTLMVQNRP